MNTAASERNILVRVDVQNDFITGSLAVNQGEHVVRPLNEVAAAVRDSGGQVVDTRDWHPEQTPHFDTWPVHCVAGTEGAELHPALRVEASDILLSKGMEQTDGYSGWEGVAPHGQTLETIIQPRTTEEKVQVFIGGLATDYCVKATAIDISERFGDDERIRLYMLRDAIRAVNLEPRDEHRAIEAMQAAKYFAITSQEAIRMIQETA